MTPSADSRAPMGMKTSDPLSPARGAAPAKVIAPVTCADGNYATDTNTVCISAGIPGCIAPNGTWAGQ